MTLPLCAFLALVMLGILQVALGLKALGLARQSRRWHRAKGRIVHSAVEAEGPDLVDSDVVRVNVRYEYEVAGKEFAASTIAFGLEELMDSAEARAITERYPEGAEVTVHYAPENPEEAVLETTRVKYVATSLVAGLILIAGAVAVLFLCPCRK